MERKSDFIPNRQLRRCLAIIKILARNRYGLGKDDIFDKLREENVVAQSSSIESIRRAFYRDLKELQICGCDVSRNKDNRYVLNNREEILSGAFSFEEIQALLMCRGLFGYFEKTHLKNTIDNVLNDVIGCQKTQFKKNDIKEADENFIVHLGWHRDFTDKNESLDTIVWGVNNSIKLKAEYKHLQKDVENIIVSPYKIVLYHDSLYLLAKKENDTRGLILYHVSRFKNVDVSGEEFEKNPDLIKDYEEKLSNCFGIFIENDLCDIEIEFDKSVESAVKERLWHKSQEIETENGRVILKLRVYNSGEFMGWVKSWGDAVKKIKCEKVVT
jgi:predicted DNA-binding transcriptional regulator YafY